MATYTSVRNGNWNASDVDTWGLGLNTYPPYSTLTKINIGHVVTYNVSSSSIYGDINNPMTITNGGKLKAKRDMDTLLVMGHSFIYVQSGGEIDYGKDGDLISATNKAEILFTPSGGDNGGITVWTGGKFYSVDNSAYYGSLKTATLQADWTTGKTFYVNENVVDKWLAGMQLTVHKNPALYSNFTTDMCLATVSTTSWDGSKSAITIVESFPGGTYKVGGRVEMVSRNVLLGKSGAVTTIGNANSNRPSFNMVNTAQNVFCAMGGLWTGWMSITAEYNTPISAVIRNGYYGLFGGNGNTFSGVSYSNTYGISGGTGYTISGVIYSITNALYQPVNANITADAVLYSNTTAVSGATNCIINGNIFSNNTGVYFSNGCTVPATIYKTATAVLSGCNNNFSGSIYSCTIAMREVFNTTLSGAIYSCGKGIQNGAVKITGRMGYNFSDTSLPNTTDLIVSNYGSMDLFGTVFVNAKLPLNGLVYTRNLTTTKHAYFCSEHHNNEKDTHIKFDNMGDVKKNTTIVRTGGAASSIEVVPLSNCSTVFPIHILGKWVEDNVPALEQTRRIKIKGEGWNANFPLNTELYFEVEYLNNATTLTTTTLTSTAVLSDNTTWVDFSVVFVPLQIGKVTYKAYLKKYASSCKVYIDNALYRGDKVTRYPIWSEGESHLQIRQEDVIGGSGGISRSRTVNRYF